MIRNTTTIAQNVYDKCTTLLYHAQKNWLVKLDSKRLGTYESKRVVTFESKGLATLESKRLATA